MKMLGIAQGKQAFSIGRDIQTTLPFKQPRKCYITMNVFHLKVLFLIFASLKSIVCERAEKRKED